MPHAECCAAGSLRKCASSKCRTAETLTQCTRQSGPTWWRYSALHDLYLRLVQKVPVFVQSLGEDSSYALGATCCLLPEAAHATAQVATMPHVGHLQYPQALSLPSLRLVVISNRHRLTHQQSRDHKCWRVLLSLKMEKWGGSCTAFFSRLDFEQKLGVEDYHCYADQLSAFLYSLSDNQYGGNSSRLQKLLSDGQT